MKRNIFLSVFLPLFLCAAILTLGYFSPTLFSRMMPNFKNKESAAQITGAESPLYLEDPSSLVLPPWNDIDDSKSQVYASDDNSVPGTLQDRIIQELYIYAEGYGDDSLYEIADNLTLSQCYIEVSDAYVRSIIQPFLKGCRILPNMKFSGSMHTYDPNSEYPEIPKYVYARNVTVKTVEGRDFIVDFVFTPQYGLPLYVHATEVDASTRAMPDNDAFTAAASTALTLFQRFSSYSTSEFDEDAFIKSFEEEFGTYGLYSSVFNSFLNAPGSLFTEFISQENINEAQWTSNMWSRLYLENIWFWNQFIYNKESVSGITYNDESLLVLRATNGCSLTMTYDYISKSVTGFGIDPNFLTSGDSTLFYDTDLTSQLNFEKYSDEIFSYGGCPPSTPKN